jgi:signal transduction histidine kinase
MYYALEPIIVLTVAAFIMVLGGIILAQDFRNHTNLGFVGLTIMASAWGFGVGAYLLTDSTHPELLDFLARLLYLAGTSTAVPFLYLARAFDEENPPSKAFFWTLVGIFALSAWLYFGTDLVVAGAIYVSESVRGFHFGPLRFLVDVELWGLFGVALVILIRKYRLSSREGRLRIAAIMVATYTTLAIAGVANDILLTYGIFEYLWVGPTALAFWLSTIAYAVARLQLFSVRVVATEAFIVLLWIVLLVRTMFSENPMDFGINAGIFLIMLVLGVFLIRSIVKQVKQRELIEAQAKEIAFVNGQQETLMHFISHEIKGYFTKSEATFAGIGEGDFGEAPPALKGMASHALEDVRTGATMVINILDASNLKKGVTGYDRKPFDFVAAVTEVASKYRPLLAEKKLTVRISMPPRTTCMIVGDELKIKRHVIENLVDNAVRYTLFGEVRISASCADGRARLVVEDTGVGITPADMPKLFTEGGKGKDSTKVNVHSTGYGLYIAKQVVDAHGGTIKAFSEGSGKGARFEVELPPGEKEK